MKTKKIEPMVVAFNGKISPLIKPRPIKPGELSVVHTLTHKDVVAVAPDLADAAIRALCDDPKNRLMSALFKKYGEPTWLQLSEKPDLTKKPSADARNLPENADDEEQKFLTAFFANENDLYTDFIVEESEDFMRSPRRAIYGGKLHTPTNGVDGPDDVVGTLRTFASSKELALQLAFDFEVELEQPGSTVNTLVKLSSMEAVRRIADAYHDDIIVKALENMPVGAVWCEQD